MIIKPEPPKLFTHAEDDNITVNDFTCILAEFLLNEPGYALPSAVIAQSYDGTMRTLTHADNSIEEVAGAWPDGERYISRVSAYRFARAARAGEYQTKETLAEIKAARIAVLQRRTYEYIAARMPDWRLARWKAYHQLSKRVQADGLSSLDAVEQAEYNAFPDPNETHAQCAQYVPLAIQWTIDCVTYHTSLEVAIYQAADIAEVNAIDVDTPAYPAWPL